MKQFNFKKSSRRLLTAFMVTLFAGTMTANAETVTDDFSGYTTTSSGTTLGDNWVIIPGTDGSWASFGSNKDYIHYNEYGEHYVAGNSASNYTKGVWLVLKKQVTGTVTFTATNGNSSSAFTIYASKAVVSGDSYEVTGTAQSYSVPSRTSTAKTYTFDAGSAPTYVAFCLVGTSKNPKLQSVTYTEYAAAAGKATSITDFTTTTASVSANSQNKYDASFTVSVMNAGTEAITASDNVTVSLMDATGGTVLATSDPIAIAKDATENVVLNYQGTATTDQTVTFKVKDNFADKVFETTASVDVKAYGARFAIDDTSADFGFAVQGATVAGKTFKVTNSGSADMTITIAPPTGFTSSTASLTVAAGTTESFAISLNTATAGAFSGNVALTFNAVGATSQDIAVSGFVADASKYYATFDDNKLPESWSDNTGWTFSDGKAVSGIDTQMTLPTFTVAAGEKFAIVAKATGSNPELYYWTSPNRGFTWSDKSKNMASAITQDGYSVIYIEGLAPGSYKLKLQGYHIQLDGVSGFTLNEDAPEMTVTPTTDADFGNKVKAQPEAMTYTIYNIGTGTLTGTITSSDPTQFTVSKSSFSLAKDESMTFDVALVFDTNYGDKEADITIHPTNDGLSDVVIKAKATTKDPNIWEEDFEEGKVPEGWVANSWVVTKSNYKNNGTYMLAAGTSTNTAYSPRLYAEKDQVLEFDVAGVDETDFLTVKWASSRDAADSDWTLIDEFKTEGRQSFTAPATGYYFLSFQGRYTSVDNFLGFKPAPLDHDVAITAQSIPATGYQYAEYKASVTVKEMTGKAEELTVKFFIGTTQYGESVVKSIAANASETITVTFTPEEAVSGKAYFTITGTGINVTSTETDVVINAATVWKDTETNEVTAGVYPALVIQYTLAQGWNSICLPAYFNLSDFDSDGLTFFSFTGYEGGALKFSKETTMINAATPYLVYSTKAATISFKLTDISIFSYHIGDENTRITKNGAIFQGTYTPMAAGTLTGKYGVIPATGKIVKGDATTTMKGFRAYFELPANTTAPTISIDGETTGLRPTPSPSLYGGEVYDLSGRKLTQQPSAKGLYIVNGRKVVIK